MYPPPSYPPPSPGRPSDNTPPYSAEDVDDDRATMMRTPSPTPEEAKLLSLRGFTDWQEAKKWRWWFRWEMIKTYLVVGFVVAAVVLSTVYEKPLVKTLQPFGRTLHNWSVGWLIPIGVLIILSFPPLFGSEVVQLLCGLIWGPYYGLALTIIGTFTGELILFLVYKHVCFKRSQRVEKENIEYACFAHAVREGGWFMATAARWSLLPTHFATAIFSVCGMTLWTFIVSYILSAPQLIVNVYSGYVMKLDESKHPVEIADILMYVLLAITSIATGLAAWYIANQTNRAKRPVIYARQKQRQAQNKLLYL